MNDDKRLTEDGQKTGMLRNSKFCQHCGAVIDVDCIICPKCGKQVGQIKSEPSPSVVINNSNQSTNVNTNVNQNINARARQRGQRKNKWTTFFLCLLCGWLGVHKFYEGKIGMGVLYIFTGGLFLVGLVVDLITILGKPHFYYV